MLGLYVCLIAREVIRNRDDWAPGPQLGYQPSILSSYGDGDSDDEEKHKKKEADLRFSIYDDYETIPEEYWESKETKNYPKLSSIAEYDLANDNDQMTKEADQLLRILANTEIFRKAEHQKTEPKRKLGTQDSVNALMAGMFRITGSVAATTNSDNKTDDADETVNDDFCGKSNNSYRTVSKRQSSTSSLPQPLSSSVQEEIKNPAKKVSSPASFNIVTDSEGLGKHKHKMPKERKPASFAGFSASYNLQDIQEN